MEHQVTEKPYILAVDDEQLNLELLQFILERNQYEIKGTSDDDYFFELLAERKPDLILLDVIMPRIEGFELCEKIKEHKVDKECSLKNVRVFKDYSCTLSLTDVAYGSFGHNKFYKMQMLERLDQKKWFVWTHWGRIGQDG